MWVGRNVRATRPRDPSKVTLLMSVSGTRMVRAGAIVALASKDASRQTTSTTFRRTARRARNDSFTVKPSPREKGQTIARPGERASPGREFRPLATRNYVEYRFDTLI